MEKQSLPQTENLQFQFSFFRNTWSKESTIITLHNLYLQTIGTLWKAQTECYRKLQDRPDRSNEAKMVKDAMPVVIIEGICRPHCSHAAANLEKMSRLAMYDLDHLNERTSAVKALFRALPYVSPTEASKSSYFSMPAPRKSILSPTPSAIRHWNASPGIRATNNAPASPSPVLAYGMPTPTTIPLPNLIRGGKNSTPTLR